MEAGGWSWRSDHDHASLALQRRSGGQAGCGGHFSMIVQFIFLTYITGIEMEDGIGSLWGPLLLTGFFRNGNTKFKDIPSVINTGRLFDHIFAIIIAAEL